MDCTNQTEYYSATRTVVENFGDAGQVSSIVLGDVVPAGLLLELVVLLCGGYIPGCKQLLIGSAVVPSDPLGL